MIKLYARFTNLGDPGIEEPNCLQDISMYDGKLKPIENCKCQITCIDFPEDLLEKLYNGKIIYKTDEINQK